MIPRRIIRSVPAETSDEVEQFWQIACNLHPDWQTVTYREPVDPDLFPLTHDHWWLCRHGAQKAGLIRLEALLHLGGIWLDSDVELYQPLDPLLHCSAFAAWEDINTVPDAVLGAEANHPAIKACLVAALERIKSGNEDWRTGNGAWATGPGVTTSILPGRDDVLLLPPGSFFPIHYSRKQDIPGYQREPWTFGIHHWHGSWL